MIKLHGSNIEQWLGLSEEEFLKVCSKELIASAVVSGISVFLYDPVSRKITESIVSYFSPSISNVMEVFTISRQVL